MPHVKIMMSFLPELSPPFSLPQLPFSKMGKRNLRLPVIHPNTPPSRTGLGGVGKQHGVGREAVSSQTMQNHRQGRRLLSLCRGFSSMALKQVIKLEERERFERGGASQAPAEKKAAAWYKLPGCRCQAARSSPPPVPPIVDLAKLSLLPT